MCGARVRVRERDATRARNSDLQFVLILEFEPEFTHFNFAMLYSIVFHISEIRPVTIHTQNETRARKQRTRQPSILCTMRIETEMCRSICPECQTWFVCLCHQHYM